MQTIDTEMNPLITRMDAPLEEAQTGNYGAVRFNTLKHGVLSRHVVLPHEDRQEFEDLLAALVFEHQPGGATELHLVEELAGILWRQRRVLMAEGAKINEGLKSAVNSAKTVMPAAAPFQRGLSGENNDLRDVLDGTPEEIAERLRNAELDLDATRKAAAILRKGGAKAYERARQALIPESRDWGTTMSRTRSTQRLLMGSHSSFLSTSNPRAFAWLRRRDSSRQSRRKPSVKAYKCTVWCS